MIRRLLRTRFVFPAIGCLLAAGTAAVAAPGVPETKTLPNGIQVIVLEDHTLPLVAASVWVHAGSKDEIDSSAGYAHFLEHLVQRGSDTAGPFEYQRLAHRWGGSLTVRSNYDRTFATVTGVSSMLDRIVEAVAGLALRARLEDTQIDQELGTLSQEVKTYYDDPATVAFLESMRAAFPKHPYRFPPLGNYKTIGTLKHDPLAGFYRNLYVPNNMVLVLAGDLDPARARTLAEQAFGKTAASATLPPKPPIPGGFAGHEDKEKPLDMNQPWTTLTFVGPGYAHPDRPAFEILVRAFGEAGGSPILKALARAEAGSKAEVAYDRLEDASLFYVGMAPSTPEMSYAAATAALGQIAETKKRGLTEAEVKGLVQRFLREERLKAERVDAVAESLGEAALFGGIRYYWDLPGVYGRLTAADLNRVAQKYLVGENCRLVVLLPKKTAPLAEEPKARFHQALDALGGVSPDAPPPAFDRRLYTGPETTKVRPEAWGDPRDARAARTPATQGLDRGLRLVVQEDHRRPLVGVSLQMPFGSGDDPAGKEGLAFLSARLLVAAAPAGGGRVLPEILVTRDTTEARFLAAPEDLRSGLAGLAAALSRPSFTDAALESAKARARDTLGRADFDAGVAGLDLFHEKVYAGHPYAHPPIGTVSGLAAITRADVEAFLRDQVRPARAALAVAGDVDAAAMKSLARDAFAAWGAAPAKGSDAPKKAATADSAPETVSANAGAQAGEFTRLSKGGQSSVIVGVPGPSITDADFGALRVLSAGLTVMAFEDMVFERRAAFSAAAFPEAFRLGGSFAMSVASPPARRDEAVFDLQRLMRRTTVEEIDPKDLDDYVRVEIGREAAALQGVLALAGTLAWREASGLGAASARDALAPPPGLTPAAIRTLAGRVLRPEAWIVVKVGP